MINNHDHSTPGSHGEHQHGVFDTPEMFVEKFDGPARDVWQKPDEVIEALNLSDTALVVEVGAGTGYFAVRLAEHVKNGKVMCFDQSSQMTSYLKARVSTLGLTNVYVHTTKPDGSLEFEEKADLIFSVDVYHHLQERIAYFSNIAHHLKSEGMLAIIDRTEEKVVSQPTGHRVPKVEVEEEMKRAGFELVKEFIFLLPVQYFLIFKRSQ